MDKGSATTATVRPASASARRLSSLYPSRRTVTSFGVSDFVLIVDQLRRFHATVRRGRPPCLAHAPRSARLLRRCCQLCDQSRCCRSGAFLARQGGAVQGCDHARVWPVGDRKSTRLNSSH